MSSYDPGSLVNRSRTSSSPPNLILAAFDFNFCDMVKLVAWGYGGCPSGYSLILKALSDLPIGFSSKVFGVWLLPTGI